jgi:hypothetical protein
VSVGLGELVILGIVGLLLLVPAGVVVWMLTRPKK